MDYVSMIPGSVHDFKIFRENQTYLLFTGRRWKDGMHGDVRYQGLFDSGYQGAGRLMDALLPSRRQPRQDLTVTQLEHNRALSSQRIIVENYFSRLKACWKILGGVFRGRQSFLKPAIDACIALTNILIIKYPLRGERPEAALAIISTDRSENWSEAEDIFSVQLSCLAEVSEGSSTDNVATSEGTSQDDETDDDSSDETGECTESQRLLNNFFTHIRPSRELPRGPAQRFNMDCAPPRQRQRRK
jgi:hypothetical protein